MISCIIHDIINLHDIETDKDQRLTIFGEPEASRPGTSLEDNVAQL